MTNFPQSFLLKKLQLQSIRLKHMRYTHAPKQIGGWLPTSLTVGSRAEAATTALKQACRYRYWILPKSLQPCVAAAKIFLHQAYCCIGLKIPPSLMRGILLFCASQCPQALFPKGMKHG